MSVPYVKVRIRHYLCKSDDTNQSVEQPVGSNFQETCGLVASRIGSMTRDYSISAEVVEQHLYKVFKSGEPVEFKHGLFMVMLYPVAEDY